MVVKVRDGRSAKKTRPDAPRLERTIGAEVNAAITQGFVVGREVLLGRVPGIVVGYNIANFGQFPGSDFPLLVRTALGVTKCGIAEVSLA